MAFKLFKTATIAFFLVLLLVQPVFAYKLFWYSDEIDRRDNIEYAERYPYDGWDIEDFNNFNDYNCINLDDYNKVASYDSYDSFEPLTAENIGKSDFKKLRYQDQLRIINEDPYDQWDMDTIDDYGDMRCWTLKDYNSYAAQKPHDKWDVVLFRDFDDLETVQNVGSSRYNFFELDDFENFDLQYTIPHTPYHTPYRNYKLFGE
jgi:hypothetical protein